MSSEDTEPRDIEPISDDEIIRRGLTHSVSRRFKNVGIRVGRFIARIEADRKRITALEAEVGRLREIKLRCDAYDSWFGRMLSFNGLLDSMNMKVQLDELARLIDSKRKESEPTDDE